MSVIQYMHFWHNTPCTLYMRGFETTYTCTCRCIERDRCPDQTHTHKIKGRSGGTKCTIPSTVYAYVQNYPLLPMFMYSLGTPFVVSSQGTLNCKHFPRQYDIKFGLHAPFMIYYVCSNTHSILNKTTYRFTL